MRANRFFATIVIAAASLSAMAQDQVVYHIDDAAAHGLKGLRNIRNHLDVDPGVKITVVTHSLGVDLLLEGQKAPNGGDYASLVSGLTGRGVKFEVCEITLKNRNLKREPPIRRMFAVSEPE